MDWTGRYRDSLGIQTKFAKRHAVKRNNNRSIIVHDFTLQLGNSLLNTHAVGNIIFNSPIIKKIINGNCRSKKKRKEGGAE